MEQQRGETHETTLSSPRVITYRLIPSGILPQILKFTPEMTSYRVTYCFSKSFPSHQELTTDESHKSYKALKGLSPSVSLQVLEQFFVCS